jgi:hypothetical protein
MSLNARTCWSSLESYWAVRLQRRLQHHRIGMLGAMGLAGDRVLDTWNAELDGRVQVMIEALGVALRHRF